MDYYRRHDLANRLAGYYKKSDYGKYFSREIIQKRAKIYKKIETVDKFWHNTGKPLSISLGSMVALCLTALNIKDCNNAARKESFEQNQDIFVKQNPANVRNSMVLPSPFFKIEGSNPEFIKKIADSWSKTYNVPNNNGEFTQFVAKMYKIAEKLNLQETNSGWWNSTKYPSKKDQIVDEMLGAFANESNFKADARSIDGLYHGLFQLSAVGMKEIVQKGAKIRPLTMLEFEKLSLIEQLDYFLVYAIICKKYYSNLGDKRISPKQVYAMLHYPSLGNPSHIIHIGKKDITGAELIESKAAVIRSRQNEREKRSPLELI